MPDEVLPKPPQRYQADALPARTVALSHDPTVDTERTGKKHLCFEFHRIVNSNSLP